MAIKVLEGQSASMGASRRYNTLKQEESILKPNQDLRMLRSMFRQSLALLL